MIKTKLDFVTGDTNISYASIELETNILIVYNTEAGREIHILDTKTNLRFSLPFKEMNTEEEIKQYGLDMLDLFKNMKI